MPVVIVLFTTKTNYGVVNKQSFLLQMTYSAPSQNGDVAPFPRWKEGGITKDDVFILQASEERSQHQNRAAAVARFRSLVGEAIQPRNRRKQTKVSRNQKRKRLEAKRRHSEKKRLRKDPKIPPR